MRVYPRLTFPLKVRLLNAFRFVLRSERSRTPMSPAQLFQPLITESHGSLMELDYNIHSEFTNLNYVQYKPDNGHARIQQHLFPRR